MVSSRAAERFDALSTRTGELGERQKVGGQAQGVADVEELFLSVQLELVQCFRPRLPPKAVELLNS